MVAPWAAEARAQACCAGASKTGELAAVVAADIERGERVWTGGSREARLGPSHTDRGELWGSGGSRGAGGGYAKAKPIEKKGAKEMDENEHANTKDATGGRKWGKKGDRVPLQGQGPLSHRSSFSVQGGSKKSSGPSKRRFRKQREN
jgi:hypothetical protein